MIEVKNLTKQFGPKTAVDNVTFSVKKGEVLGFLGPNGAGKSTTMRMITGFLPPSGGEISVDGIDITKNPIAAKAKIGYLPEAAPLYSDMTVKGFLHFMARMRGVNKSEEDAAVNRVMDLCHLHGVQHQSIDTLSKGYRHRTCFAQSIIHDPDILILDEPTDGLDPNQKHEVRAIIRRMGENKVIIFSTHILEEVDAVCSRAIVIDKGRVVADGTPADLRARAPKAGAVVVTLAGPEPQSLTGELKKLKGVDIVEPMDGAKGVLRARLVPSKKASSAEISSEVFKLASAKQLELTELHVEEGRLDEFFRAQTTADTASEVKLEKTA